LAVRDLFRPEPSALATHTCIASPDRSEVKEIRRPSGENCGSPSKSDDLANDCADRPGSNR
jgi:hypothetical protein